MSQESSLASNVWAQRSLGIDQAMAQNLTTVNAAGIWYLCNYRYPFLQLVNEGAVFDEDVEMQLIKSSAEWVVHDYGEAISVSRPHSVIPKQDGVMAQINTVYDIAAMISKKGWDDVEIIAGTDLMQRFLWLESRRYGFNLKGFTPSEKDEKCLERIKQQIENSGGTWKKQPLSTKQKIHTSSAD